MNVVVKNYHRRSLGKGVEAQSKFLVLVAKFFCAVFLYGKKCKLVRIKRLKKKFF